MHRTHLGQLLVDAVGLSSQRTELAVAHRFPRSATAAGVYDCEGLAHFCDTDAEEE